MQQSRKSPQEFLDLIKKSKKGKLKIYIGMSAGVGKTYRMLQEAHIMQTNGIDVKIGYIETHKRKETEALVHGLPNIPRKKVFYKGKELAEMDVQAIINIRPEVVIIDELAHSNIQGSRNYKRWQDVYDIIESGINVITAVNIQHIESVHLQIQEITGIEVQERVPDRIISEADEVVNIDLSADELISRLREGKIYPPDKIETALKNFFTIENILQLRELALKEVASQVERKVDTEIKPPSNLVHQRFLAYVTSDAPIAKNVIRKTARLANYYNSRWFVLYVQTPAEHPDKIPSDKQRYLINNLKLATELGAEILQIESPNVAQTLAHQLELKNVSTLCLAKQPFSLIDFLRRKSALSQILKSIANLKVDVIIIHS